jgi:thiol peroxidase
MATTAAAAAADSNQGHTNNEIPGQAGSGERYGAVSFKGVPQTVLGRPLQVGDPFPSVSLVAPDLGAVDLNSFEGQVRLVSVVPSLDTGICDAQTRRFNDEAEKFGDQLKVITVSADIPFAQRRWIKEAEVKNITVLSDHQNMSFGDATGTHIRELRLNQRSIFVVDRNNTVAYVEYVPEVAQHPDYDAALEAARKLIPSS